MGGGGRGASTHCHALASDTENVHETLECDSRLRGVHARPRHASFGMRMLLGRYKKRTRNIDLLTAGCGTEAASKVAAPK